MNFTRPYILSTSGFRYFVVLVGFLCLSLASLAQDEEPLHSVRIELKSGTIIEGKLVSIEYEDEVEILTPIGENLVIQWADIAELNFIDSEVRRQVVLREKRVKEIVPYNDTGFFFSFDVGPPMGIDYWGDPVMGGSAIVSVGKGLGHQNSLGVTTGIEFYLWPYVTVAPIGLEYRQRFRKSGFSWFYYVQLGYGSVAFSEYTNGWVGSNGSARGGTYFNPGVGFTKKTHPKRSWYMKFGYKGQRVHAEYDSQIWNLGVQTSVHIEEKVQYQRFEVKYGLLFN